MRNLRNVRQLRVDVDHDDLPLTATAWDPSQQSAICAFGPTEDKPTITLKTLELAPDQAIQSSSKSIAISASWDALCPSPDLKCDRILSLHCFAEDSTTCLILAGGDIVQVKTRQHDADSQDIVAIVGSVEEGIAAAAWSPDDESLAIFTRVNTLIFMTREFDPIATVTLSPDDINVSSHVSVGWGKKETQFKGKRAKSLHDPTIPEYVDEGTLSSVDTGLSSLSWRGDGAYVVLNSVQDSKTRMLRVYTREGVLDSVSEPVNGLEGALSWRPAGNLIAGIQRFSDHVDVVFYERNGLRHGQFSLRLSEQDLQTWAQTIELNWNVDSTVLAISFKDRVQFWTMGNYHYYLKQEIHTHPSSHSDVAHTTWHPDLPLSVVVRSAAALEILNFAFTVSAGPTNPPYDNGLIAVIDGTVLKLTPLRLANVPPPMSLADLDLPHIAIDVAINCSATKLAVLSAQHINTYSIDFRSMPFGVPQLLDVKEIKSGRPRQVVFTNEHDIVILHNDSTLSSLRNSTVHYNTYTHCTEIASFCKSIDNQITAFQDLLGNVYGLHKDDSNNLSAVHIAKFTSLRSWTGIWSHGTELIVFGLSTGGLLSALLTSFLGGLYQEVLAVPNCTSFLLTPAHLVYTTNQHLLKFIHLHAGNLDIPLDEPEKDERCRSIERGAKLVTVMPSAYSLTLQMPRGNLETIYPRALVLAGIRKSMADLDYKTAFLACRSHRVDMNILHDFAPAQFMENIGLFVKQLGKVGHIDLFLSQLREEDVSLIMYKDTLDVPPSLPTAEPALSWTQSLATQTSSKVNRICDALLEVFSSHTGSHLQNLVTAHVCKTPPDLEAGLGLIARLRREQPELVDQAIEHICFLADVNRLYETSLGLYDLDVALLVAQQSQKDPREYLPHLQRLKELPPVRREFTIDNELRRYVKALSHLFTLDDFEQLSAYTVKHELYSEAMHLYRYQSRQLNVLTRMYAEYLASRDRHGESALALEYLGDYEAATNAYRMASMWRECLSSANLASLPAQEITQLATSLVDGLIEDKDYVSAAAIYTDYLGDIGEAVRNLGQCYQFAEAIRLIGLHKQPDLLTSVLDPSLVDAFSNTTETLAEMRSQLCAQVPRIRELQIKKKTDALSYFGGGEGNNGTSAGLDIPDDISLASTAQTHATGTTLATRYTTASSNTLSSSATRKTARNKKREERKRARGKQGSVYEEEYLVNSVRRLIERLESVGGDECERLVAGLVRRRMRERAIAVTNAAHEVWDLVRGCVQEVFGPSQDDGVRGSGLAMENFEEDGVHSEWRDIGSSASAGLAMPVVRDFKKLSMLG